MDNSVIADRLLDVAHELERRRGNLYRVRAYRRAAEVVLGLDCPVEQLVASAGRSGLRKLPGIGTSLAEKIESLVRAGTIPNVNDSEGLLAGT